MYAGPIRNVFKYLHIIYRYTCGYFSNVGRQKWNILVEKYIDAPYGSLKRLFQFIFISTIFVIPIFLIL